jgi:glycine betaine/proline transport system substrate-binding protein
LKSIRLLVAMGALSLGTASHAVVREPAACRNVRLADVGWTDITSTTALTSTLLAGLGYVPKTEMLSIPVTYASLKNRQIDVYLGDWQPSMAADRQPYLADGSIDVLGANLSGAKFTLAVPDYVAAAGVRDFADLAQFAGRFGRKIYAIEPGNSANRIIGDIIAKDRFALGGWTLVESSEQGMLSEVQRSIRRKDWIVFLGWAPHPMNLQYRITYLSGGDDTFGPGYGGATVYTDVRAGYLSECPNVGALLHQLHFTLEIESAIMALILNDHLDGQAAANRWLVDHPAAVADWLGGVATFDGRPGLPAVQRSLHAAGLSQVTDRLDAANDWVVSHKLPLGAWLSSAVHFTTGNSQGLFDGVSMALGWVLAALASALLAIPPLLFLSLLAASVLTLRRSAGFAAFVALSLLLILNLGYWQAMMETLSLVTCATVFSVLVGVPTGIAAAHRPWLHRLLQPGLDLMQTVPTFVYLIPTLVLFGLGPVPGLISTVIFAIPAPIRLTYLGVSSVPKSLLEAGQAFGASRTQLLFKIELPCAWPTILAGVTQCIMLSLSMVVIAALVGADGLGKPVVRALNSVNIAMGFEAAIAIVALAIILDRLCKGSRRGTPR